MSRERSLLLQCQLAILAHQRLALPPKQTFDIKISRTSCIHQVLGVSMARAITAASGQVQASCAQQVLVEALVNSV
jgi:hypothetical protein